MQISIEGGGAELRLKRLSLGHYGKLFVSGQRYKHIFENFKRRNINGFPCGGQGKWHPELTFSLAQRKSMQKESKTEGLPEQLCHPELDSGSSHRNITPLPEKITNITSTSCTAKRQVKGDFVPPKESETEWLPKQLCHPELGSGSCQRYIIPNKKKINNISFASNSAKRHVKGDLVSRRVAFTLAEVLITLGIIGVVAAMTLPALIAKHNKNVVETKLKKFYTTMNQAILLSENKNGDKKYWTQIFKDADGNTVNDEGTNIAYTKESLENFYNTYLKDFLNVTETKIATVTREDNSTGSYLLLYFADGSSAAMSYGGSDYMYCITAKYLEDSYVYGTGRAKLGRECFMFGFYPKGSSSARSKYFKDKGVEPYIDYSWDGTKEGLKTKAVNYAKLIQLNGWKIPDDYPIKF